MLAAVGTILMLAHLAQPATADTAPTNPADPRTPVTVSADALPTAQINGVVWSQVIIGNTVYAAGSFTNARPPGAAANTNTTPRSNLVAYDIRTGALSTAWAPTADAQVRSITRSPDGSRIYIGGDFTRINGQTRYRVAALNPTNGALINWAANPNGYVRSVVATADTVYIGGHFSAISGADRTRVGAVSAANGAVLPFNPRLTYGEGSGYVWAMAVSPDQTKVAFGGAFVTVNGSSNPGYGMAIVSSSSGALLPMPANGVLRDAGPSAAMTSMASDGDSLYVTGYDFGAGGNFEGTSRISWATGQIVWVEDCHGDSYGVHPQGDVIYKASHAHYCGNLPEGGYPQTEPNWTFHWGSAFTKTVRGTLGRDLENYPNFEGQPAPGQLPWDPKLEQGSYTGINQAAWTITGNSDYIVLGGEFPRAAVTPGGSMATQQGLVRYARSGLSINRSGPEIKGAATNPRVTSVTTGTARVSWTANWDRDNENLTYWVEREGAGVVHQRTVASREGYRPQQGYTDSGLSPGTYRYRLATIDPFNNRQWSDWVSVTVPATGRTQSAYAKRVLDDGAGMFWRLSESSGSAVVDWAGTRNGVASGLIRGTAGAIVGDSDTASTFAGISSSYVVNSDGSEAQPAEMSTNFLTQEAWVRTSSIRGGQILGFGNSRTGSSSNADRVVYMTSNGRIAFGTNPAVRRTITSATSYNNNQWHHVVATLGASGMALYVDGVQVGERADTTRGDFYYGYWRVGGGNLANWPNRPLSDHLSGAIDDVAIYPVALSASTISAHHALGRNPGTVPNAAPVAAFTSTTSELSVAFDSSGSSDSDGTVTSRSWSFGDGQSSTAVSPTHTYDEAGTYTVTLTVTDDDGATDTETRSLTVSTAPPAGVLAVDGFGRTVTGGLGSAETGGAWSLGGAASAYGVDGSVGTIRMATAGSGYRAWLPGVSSSAVDVTIKYGLDKVADGGGMFFSLGGRVVGTNDYRAKVKIGPDGVQTLYLVRVLTNAETTLGSVVLPAGLTYTAGSSMQLRLQVEGASPTTLRVKVWQAGAAEPAAWTLTRTDSSAGLQVAGGVGVATYLSGTSTNIPVTARFDDLNASTIG
jgi:PKD repeat protein